MARLLFLIVAFTTTAFAQRHAVQNIFVTNEGKYQINYYSDSIIKLTFQPNRYEKAENVSDAVIMKPAVTFRGDAIRISNDTVFGFGKPIIVGTHESDGHKGFKIALGSDEKIFGGGERALPLNRRGYRFNLYNNPWYGYSDGADNLNYSVPFFTSSAGYGLFFDNPSKGYVDIGKANPGIFEYGASSGELNVYIIFGDFKTILQSYHKLTGTQPLPPRWALGNLMSRFGYTSEVQVKDIYHKMKNAGVPVDAVIFDLFWFGDSIKGTMGNLDWVNKKAWPNPRKMIADFKKEGVQTILVTEPFFVETAKNYIASKPYLAVDSMRRPYYLTDFYFGKGGLIDIFRKDAQSWFWQFYKKQMQNGVEAWWGDLGEPEKHPSNMYHNLRDLRHKRLFAADEVHNLYGHTWTKMLYHFYAKEYPNKRLFSLNRAGFAGSQRYSIFPWTGDVSRSWEGLRAQLPILLGMSMSGVPYVHSDAGGFAGGTGDPELYVRWLQFAAFTPIFRPHGTALYERETAAFSFPSEAALIDTPYRKYAIEAISNRYAFLTYNYNLAYQQARYGKPLIAPMYYHFPNDTAAARIQDQFMWGESILVAPVLEKGAVVRTTYLPEGRWFHRLKGEIVDGAQWRSDTILLSQTPLFIREGSFLQVGDLKGFRNTSTYKDDVVNVEYFMSSKPSSYEMFLDDGQTKGSLEKKQFELITIRTNGVADNTLAFTVTSNNGMYKGKPSKRTMNIDTYGISQKARVWINGKLVKEQQQEIEGVLPITFQFAGKPVTIKIQW